MLKSSAIATATLLAFCLSNYGATPATKPTVVTRIDANAILAELRIRVLSQLSGPCECGWSVCSLDANGRGEVYQLAIAVCGSREEARALYERQIRYLSTAPPGYLQDQCKAGDVRTLGMTWAFFARDNVFVYVSWNQTHNNLMLERLDKMLTSESNLVSRGHFVEVPRLKDLPEKVSMVPGQTAILPFTWEGMGRETPSVYVTSPGFMSNGAQDAKVQLRVSGEARPESYPVTVCAVGEGLVFAKATIEVTIQPAKADTEPATRPSEPSSETKRP